MEKGCYLEKIAHDAPMPIQLMHITDDKLKEKIQRCLNRSGNNLTKAARMMGQSRPTFLKYCRQYGLWPETREELYLIKKQKTK